MTERRKTKDKNSKNVPELEIYEDCISNTVNKKYQHDSRVLSTFVPNRLFDQLLNTSLTNNIYSKIFHSEPLYIEV